MLADKLSVFRSNIPLRARMYAVRYQEVGTSVPSAKEKPATAQQGSRDVVWRCV